MAGAAFRRSVWLICNRHSFYAVSSKLAATLPTDSARTITKMVGFSSAAAYFLIFNCGFCSSVKASGSGKVELGGKDNSRAELTTLLKSYEFSEAQIDEIIKKHPKVLSYRVSANLKPKLDYLVECGFSGSALRIVLASNPRILGASLDASLKPRYQFFKTYLRDKVNLVLRHHSEVLCGHTAETNVEYLKEQGVPDSSITRLLALEPRILMYGKNRLAKMVEATKELGIEPSATMFIRYLWVLGSMSETSWKKKVEVFKSLGWSDEDVRATLSHCPTAFRVSEEKLRRNMDFYINNVRADPRDVIDQPILLQFSLNERIIPRYEVLQLLKRYNLIKSCKMTAFFRASEKQFITKYIENNLDEVPHLLQVYCDSRKAKSDTPRWNP